MSDLRLRTDRLLLEPLAPEHLDFVHRLWTDPQVRRYLWDDEVVSREQANDEIVKSVASFRDHDFGLLVIRRAEDGREIGFCGLRFIDDRDDVEILYGLLPEHWGRGLATEAGREVMRWAFVDLGLERLIGRTDPPNAASARVLERLGMDFVRRVEENGMDTAYYSIEAVVYLSGMQTC